LKPKPGNSRKGRPPFPNVLGSPSAPGTGPAAAEREGDPRRTACVPVRPRVAAPPRFPAAARLSGGDMGETTGQAPVPQDPASGFEKTLLERGWVTPEQVATATRHQAERKAAGESLTLAQSLVALNLLTRDQVREAMSAQGEKASL